MHFDLHNITPHDKKIPIVAAVNKWTSSLVFKWCANLHDVAPLCPICISPEKYYVFPYRVKFQPFYSINHYGPSLKQRDGHDPNFRYYNQRFPREFHIYILAPLRQNE